MIATKTLLIVLGGGGHTAQMRRLQALLGDRYRYEYVAARDDALAAHAVPQGSALFRVLDPRRKDDRNPFVIAFRTAGSFFDAFHMLLQSDASVIVACGPALAVPVCLAGKLLGKKVIYLESWSRVRTQSLSARLVRPFADLFLVQSSILRRLRGAVYAGRLG